MRRIGIGLGITFGRGGGGASGDTTPPVVTDEAISSGEFTATVNETGDFYYVFDASATPPHATAALLRTAALAATPDQTFAITTVGSNSGTLENVPTTPGTYYLHGACFDAAGNGVLTTPVSFVVAAAQAFVGGKTAAILGTTGNTTVSLTDLTGGIGSAPAENDIVVIAFAVGAGVDVDLTIVTAGYTELADIRANDDNDANLALFWKRMTSTPDTSVDIGPTTNATYAGAYAIHVWRGIDPTTAIDVATVTATGVNTGVVDAAAITPTTAGAIILVAGASSDAATTALTSGELDNFLSSASPDTIDVSVALGSKVWTSGAFDPAAFGGGSANATASWAAITAALRPAP